MIAAWLHHNVYHWVAWTWGGDGTGGSSGTGYLICSGPLTFAGLTSVVWRHLNCHEPRCMRIARHRDPATGDHYCLRHVRRGA